MLPVRRPKAAARALVVLMAVLATSACKRKETFQEIGDAVASPVDVAIDKSGKYFYALNADFDRTYDTGTILVLDTDGNKLNTVKVPRMGRTLSVFGNDMVVTYDYPDDEKPSVVKLYDITDPLNPVEKQSWDLNVSPLNAVGREGYKYFAVTGFDGSLYVGTLADDRTQSTLKHVRTYSGLRRALYLDPARELLLGFDTDTNGAKAAVNDNPWDDSNSYDQDFNPILQDGQPVRNEVPDVMERERRANNNRGQRGPFQYFVYDFKAEASNAPHCKVDDEETCEFPDRGNDDPIVGSELRWMYFKLTNFDGSPDDLVGETDPSQANFRYYRTNFYAARPDLHDPDVFYLSHRGLPTKSPYANQIVRVRITGDLHTPAPGAVPPFTENVLSFERVYGFKGAEISKYHYPSDFVLGTVNGQTVLVVNHFRDLVSWARPDTYFSVGAKILDDNGWFAEEVGSLDKNEVTTYFQVAMAPNGRVLSTSFYGNALQLLQVNPGLGIDVVKRIE
jgi:hypothetical protein